MAAEQDRFEMARHAVVLFAGAGGSSIGLHRAGFDPIGFEYWRTAADTHSANGMTCVHADLSDPTSDEYVPESPLLWASPPCQPFSIAGVGEGEFDDRDGFPWTLRIIAKRLPAVVIIENVKGLTFTKHHAYFAGILASLRGLGYDVDWRVLNSADYGVPQTRERCFIVCRRDGGPITWPMPTHTEHAGMFTEPWVTLADAVPSVAERLGRYRRGAGMTERHGERPDVNPLTPAPTVHRNTEKDLLFVHDPTVSGSQQADAIRLTIKELARLQDFPDHYVWCGTKSDQARQIGNAVPATMARVLAEANAPIGVAA